MDDESFEEDIQDEINNSGDAFAQYQIEHVESTSKKMTIDFQNDYEPLKLGVKQEQMLIVIEFQTPSNLKRFQHFIKVKKYLSSDAMRMSMSISKSNSGSFKEQLKAEVRRVV